jgi:hypothetical protein
MSRPVTQDDLFSILRDYEGKIKRLETALYERGVAVSSLPAQPFEGQDVYYVANSSGTSWHLRYRGRNIDGTDNSSAFKWEFVGGNSIARSS